MKLLTLREGDLSTYFDENDESQHGFTKSSSKHMPFNSHDNGDNKGQKKAQFPLEHFFAFTGTFEKITNGLLNELKFRTSSEKRVFLNNPRWYCNYRYNHQLISTYTKSCSLS